MSLSTTFSEANDTLVVSHISRADFPSMNAEQRLRASLALIRTRYGNGSLSDAELLTDSSGIRILAASDPSGQTLVGDGSSYTTQISLGTPGQAFTVILDTGSATLWLTSKQAPQTQAHSFDSSQSSTFASVPNGDGLTVAYGTGSVSGSLGQDNFAVGNIVATKQAFLLASQFDSAGAMASLLNSGARWDGIWGLAFPSLATASSGGVRPIPPYFNMMQQNLLKTPVFAFWLETNSPSGTGDGEFVLGGCNPNHFSGKLSCMSVLPSSSGTNDHWRVAMSGISVGSSSVSIPSGNSLAILDTGSSVMAFPDPIFQSMVQALNVPLQNSGGISVVSCSAVGSLPPITFNLGGGSFTLQGSDYVIQSGSTCYLGFVSSGSIAAPEAILGDPFLRRFYSVYDPSNLVVGLAASSGGTGLGSGSTPAQTSCFCGGGGTGPQPSSPSSQNGTLTNSTTPGSPTDRPSNSSSAPIGPVVISNNSGTTKVVGGGSTYILVGNVAINLYLVIGGAAAALIAVGLAAFLIVRSRKNKAKAGSAGTRDESKPSETKGSPKAQANGDECPGLEEISVKSPHITPRATPRATPRTAPGTSPKAAASHITSPAQSPRQLNTAASAASPYTSPKAAPGTPRIPEAAFTHNHEDRSNSRLDQRRSGLYTTYEGHQGDRPDAPRKSLEQDRLYHHTIASGDGRPVHERDDPHHGSRPGTPRRSLEQDRLYHPRPSAEALQSTPAGTPKQHPRTPVIASRDKSLHTESHEALEHGHDGHAQAHPGNRAREHVEITVDDYSHANTPRAVASPVLQSGPAIPPRDRSRSRHSRQMSGGGRSHQRNPSHTDHPESDGNAARDHPEDSRGRSPYVSSRALAWGEARHDASEPTNMHRPSAAELRRNDHGPNPSHGTPAQSHSSPYLHTGSSPHVRPNTANSTPVIPQRDINHSLHQHNGSTDSGRGYHSRNASADIPRVRVDAAPSNENLLGHQMQQQQHRNQSRSRSRSRSPFPGVRSPHMSPGVRPDAPSSSDQPHVGHERHHRRTPSAGNADRQVAEEVYAERLRRANESTEDFSQKQNRNRSRSPYAAARLRGGPSAASLKNHEHQDSFE
ncbi:aspartic peptidase domain-containing protein [Polychytrium aggregatum]|uniref:aspartic peptidase domain-containing protein n=1 Tax=Polychytrium aggregatum TaxID=110093 RepID=UPI0022FEEDC9|nr:aspartic peptidase domain-containing protein [Polychytrium aggregatum]KAI9206936.1 aspartic peptidase domain-containing protein [Polychytrium aggregatum]